MRACALLFTLCWLFVQPVAAQSFRIVTWDLDRIGTAPSSEAALQRLQQVAVHLKPLDAEVVVLHGLADAQMARNLIALLKPSTYHIAHHSVFKTSGSDSTSFGPSITILSRKPAFATRSMEWRSTGQIELPGGFAFAAFNSGANALCVYVAHLPESASGVEDQSVARKRELAAQYLAHHANWLGRTLTNQIASFYVAGDFIAEPKSARAEGAVRILQQAGFKNALPGLPPRRRVSTTGDRIDPQSILTAILARGAEFAATPQVLARKTFEQSMVAYDFTPPAPLTSPVPIAAAPTSGSPTRVFAMDQYAAWLWAGGIAVLLTAILITVWLIRRATPAAGAFRRHEQQPVVMDLNGFAETSSRFNDSRQQGESEPDPASDGSHTEASVWQARALQAEERASQATAVVRSGLLPQLRRLMRERLITWLTSQRGQLLTSHEVGTQQMLELEERLQRIQGQFQESLQTREQRIAELEEEILAKERVIRDLLRAQVRVADESANP